MWGSQQYYSRKFYAHVFASQRVHPSFSWVWKSKCIPRLKFLAWLILVNRLNTKTMLQLRNFNVLLQLLAGVKSASNGTTLAIFLSVWQLEDETQLSLTLWKSSSLQLGSSGIYEMQKSFMASLVI